MSKLLTVIAFAAAAVGSPISAKEPCPRPKYGAPYYPWLIEGVMSGDKYADIYLEIDKAGKPTDCKMGRNNIAGDDKFFVCKAFLEQWSTSPDVQAGREGPTTVKRRYIAYGEKHRKAERQAKKLFFQQHPE
jgi:hypothetical protein